MIEQHYIRLNEYRQNDYNFASLLMVEGKPFSYDIGHLEGNREQILDYITKRTIRRAESPKHTFHFKYQTLDDTKIMLKHLQEDNFYSYYNIEITPAVFASDENSNEMIKDILNKLTIQRKMFDQYNYQH